jgi:ankyrin repeat protein
MEIDARRRQIGASTAPAMSAPPSLTAAAIASAARLSGPATDLRRAAETGDLTELQTLLDKQPDIDARDAGGRTALMLATLHGQTRAVDVLLAHGADPNAADARGITPLQAAVGGNYPDIVAALQRGGAR